MKRVGTQGWKSFLASKQEMLNQYQIAQKYSKSHTVQTFHGNVAEAVFREWLSAFLPKRYAVTSGYIISQNAKDNEKMPHFDVIVYDQIESPILWHECNPDKSKVGISRAILAEYVVSVFEIKSSFEPKTVNEAITKLQEIEPLLSNVDQQTERYKKYLPKDFCSGIIFFQLKKENKYKEQSLKNVLKAKRFRGFLGALILEGEKLDSDKTGILKILQAKIPMKTTVSKSMFDLFGCPGGKNKDKNKLIEQMKKSHPGIKKVIEYWDLNQDEDGFYYGIDLMWNESNFSCFMFDLLAIWHGTFEHGYLSSFHAMSHWKD